MGGCMASVGADCWECFDPDDIKPGERDSLQGCSYALDLGNARWVAHLRLLLLSFAMLGRLSLFPCR